MFIQRHQIGYRGLDANLKADATIVMELMQETGTRHTDSTAFPMQWQIDHALGFIITNSVLKIMRAPRLGETVEVSTAPVQFKGVAAKRFYRMNDASGVCIAESLTAWALIDLNARRPARIPKELGESYGAWYDYQGFSDLSIPEAIEGRLIAEEPFRVRRRDVDANLHVNNIAYVTWAKEYVPERVHREMNAVTVKARYRKECGAGDMVTARTYEAEGENAFLTGFFGTDGNRLAEVYTEWE